MSLNVIETNAVKTHDQRIVLNRSEVFLILVKVDYLK